MWWLSDDVVKFAEGLGLMLGVDVVEVLKLLDEVVEVMIEELDEDEFVQLEAVELERTALTTSYGG